ncbi:MAG TPA: hypothetical protein VMI13_02420 [Solirubrobacteraceae bacterium]|nr:hypothetical protein [Solirubrobacteraceae bacterium]
MIRAAFTPCWTYDGVVDALMTIVRASGITLDESERDEDSAKIQVAVAV